MYNLKNNIDNMLTTRSNEPQTSRSEEYNTKRRDDLKINSSDPSKINGRCSEYQISTRCTGDTESFDQAFEYNILESEMSLKENYFYELFD